MISKRTKKIATKRKEIPPHENGLKLKPEGKDSKSVGEMAGKYLTFLLEKEEYGIGILKVKEIIGMMPVTSVPWTPGFVKGVINLRGKVIPIIDLRLKFGMEATVCSERTCIIVVEISAGEENILLGMIVDSVSEVLTIKSEDLVAVPPFGTKVDLDYISAMAKANGRIKILLDIDKVLGTLQAPALKTTGRKHTASSGGDKNH